jgi:uncharacterized protein YeaO (DUF488 family)
VADDRLAIVVWEPVIGGDLIMSNAIPAASVRLKRAYEQASRDDGKRVLVDRLWPRGVSKAEAKIDAWIKDIAPSATLRKWFDHDPQRWPEFRGRYRTELKHKTGLVRDLRRKAREGPITLVYAARDEVHNDAVVLRNVLLGRPAPRRSR